MQRAKHLFHRIPERDNLRLAFYKASKAKRDRSDQRELAACLEPALTRIADDLLAGTIEFGKAVRFTIHDPKQREITAPVFRERVLHHAIMNICEPYFERFLIDDTYACRIGKGRIAALQRAEHFSRRYPKAVKLDMRRYFDSIRHSELLTRLRTRFKDERLLDLFQKVVASHHTSPDAGLPIGSLISQHLANFYLGWFDRFVKEHLHIRGYVRYMDDCVLWGDSSTELRRAVEESGSFLTRDLHLEARVPWAGSSKSGLPFLGCRVFPTHLQLNRRSRRRYRKRLIALDEDLQRGQLTAPEFQQRTEALTAFTTAGGVKSWKFRRHVLKCLSVSGHGLEPGEPGR